MKKKNIIILSSRIHGIRSVTGFVALQFAPLFLGILEYKSDKLILGYISFILFILSFITFILFIMGYNPKFNNTIIALKGFWQRILCFLMYVPFMAWIIIQKIAV